MLNKSLFSSATDEWPTPQWLFDALDREFGFEIDVCATADNAKCKKYYSPDVDGLTQRWTGVCWMNPPYGREIIKWIEKAYLSSVENDATVVCLIPARTDTRWFHRYAMKGEVRLLRGRIRFEGATNSAPFPSAIVIFRPPKYCLRTVDMNHNRQ